MSWDQEPHDDEPNAPRPADQPLPSSGWELPPNHEDWPTSQTHRPQFQRPQFQPPQHQPAFQQTQFHQPPTNQLAVTSMVVGIIAIPALCACGLGLIAGVAAVIVGLVSRDRIRSAHGMQSGESQALTGIICGTIAVVAGAVFGLGFFVL